ncbi:SseB family protein [Streptomyces sp. NPDC048389]|uniref:SseB family protein n=1 Tax=Streptomyces sp. NPDC048389 TaxID=3154622 RepID=UPI0034561B75
MSDNGDDIPEPSRLSRLSELAGLPEWAEPAEPAGPGASAASAGLFEQPASLATLSVVDEVAVARRGFARLLGEFRRTAVLVPFDAHGSLWTADFNGVRWICAFSDEEALARFARAQGEAGCEWEYRTILGARLLDVMVPMLTAPAGVALDAGSEEGMVFPPVAGIVPDAVAVDLGGTR